MGVPKFDEKELVVIGETPGMFSVIAPAPIYSYPCTMKEAMLAQYRREPYWQMYAMDLKIMTPSVNPDNIARGFVFEANKIEPIVGRPVPDMFGIEWEFIPQAGGAMVRPGKPFAKDANELLEKIKWPEPKTWDWAGSAKANNGTFLADDSFNMFCLLNGWFERLISMLDFEGALMALFDEDQKEAVHKFFTKLSDMYIELLSCAIDAYGSNISGFNIHDDWGSQKETFFSPELCREMIVPHMRRVTDFLHSKGKYCELHSCGHIVKQVPNMIAAGWDAWSPQPMNDSQKVYELYGDKILVTVDLKLNASELTDDELRARACESVDRYMLPGKPCFFRPSIDYANRVFRDAVYEHSRKKACGLI